MYIVNIKAGKINKELCVVLNDISETQCFIKRRFFSNPSTGCYSGWVIIALQGLLVRCN